MLPADHVDDVAAGRLAADRRQRRQLNRHCASCPRARRVGPDLPVPDLPSNASRAELVRRADGTSPPPTRSSASAATCSASTPPTPATRAPPSANGSPPSTSRRSSPRSASTSSCTSPRPRRANLVARIPGADRVRGALLVHGHLDVVPADASEWSVPPFSGEEKDGYLWGRGAIDMKDFDAMMLAVVRDWQRTGYVPPRDIVLAFTADEEAGMEYGSQFLVREHRRPVRGLHRGDRRGRRLLLHGQRRPAALPGRDRREGHRLAAPARHGPARARLVHPRRQRGHRAGRGGRARSAGTGSRWSSPRPCGRSWSRSPRRSASSSTRTTRSWPSPSSARSPT